MDKVPMDNWDSLRYFLAVAEAKTVKAAANSMGVSHSTVLRQIDNFEKDMGVKLFKRLQSGYELTSIGRSILNEAFNVRQKVEQLEQGIKGHDSKLEGCLRISQPENEVIDLYPIYAEFGRLYPDITLRIISSAKVSDLKRHETDVALRLVESPKDLLVGRCVGRIDFGLYGSREYFKKFDMEPDLEDLDWIVFKALSKRVPRILKLEGWISMRVEDPKIVLETTSSSGLLNAARAGIGVGFISNATAKNYEELVELPLSHPVFSLKLWMLTNKELRHSAMVRVFMQHVANSLENQLG